MKTIKNKILSFIEVVIPLVAVIYNFFAFERFIAMILTMFAFIYIIHSKAPTYELLRTVYKLIFRKTTHHTTRQYEVKR